MKTHFERAEELVEQADSWLNADWGWKGELTTEERLRHRSGDLAAAQVHATLAQVNATLALVKATEGSR